MLYYLEDLIYSRMTKINHTKSNWGHFQKNMFVLSASSFVKKKNVIFKMNKYVFRKLWRSLFVYLDVNISLLCVTFLPFDFDV